MSPFKQTLAVAGLEVNVFSDSSAVDVSLPVVACFLLHGRLSSSQAVENVAESLIQLTREGPNHQGYKQRSLIVVTFVIDHTNSVGSYIYSLILRTGSTKSWHSSYQSSGQRWLEPG